LTSHGGEGGDSIDEGKEKEKKAEEAKKKKEKEGKEKEIPKKDQGEKEEGKKKAATVIRDKTLIKKRKVHPALNISTPDGSDDASGPKEGPATEKEPMVEKDLGNKGEDVGVHKDDIIPVTECAPNSEKKYDPPVNSDNNCKEVTSNLFL
jgi:hypothetical protein